MAIAITKPIANHQVDANTVIDNAIDKIRKKYITEITGQQAIYLKKENDARAYKNAGYPTPLSATTYPWLAAELNSVLPLQPTVTAQQVADSLIAVADQWDTVGPATEQIRRTAKNAIAAATTVTQIRAAIAAFQAAIVGL